MSQSQSNKSSNRNAIKLALRRLGPQAKTTDVVADLASKGVRVSIGFVERVRLDEIKGQLQISKETESTTHRVPKRPAKRKIPQKRPRRS